MNAEDYLKLNCGVEFQCFFCQLRNRTIEENNNICVLPTNFIRNLKNNKEIEL